MSHKDWKYLLNDIVEAIDKIEKYLGDMCFEEFEDDAKLLMQW